ncbi:unnamed protein product [Periconia digitata]|uniref:Alpha/beta hydrolase fold-3 domain-containing protein n=1 Tax=Periconia digitata TaxID=1303443 RepID=A0A9W4U4U9_9PLEO|nr:unnamed protein product [Periconia digitata]
MIPAKHLGRLGDRAKTLGTDPRTHPKLLEVLQSLHLDGDSHVGTNLTRESPLQDIISYVLDVNDILEDIHQNMDLSVPKISRSATEIVRSTKIVVGSDGNEIRLIFYRPSASLSGTPPPGVVYFHGGGMVILSTENPMHITWAEATARLGLVSIIVDFRNAVTRSGAHPFPAGLNDCTQAVQWIHNNKAELNISKIVLQGNSGGANLALATALKAKKEGWVSAIDGVFVTAPYISGTYHLPEEWKLENLPSLVECDGYLENMRTSALSSKLYDPSEHNARNPLAWPYWAEKKDLEGLPPHYIITDELDPWRDEGNAYYRKLVEAGVNAVGRMNLGMIHDGEMVFRHHIPELFLASLEEIRSFVFRV